MIPRHLDLNLLVVLKSLLEEKHVTRTAEKLNMSQPTVSRALQRLRYQLNDPLLIRRHSGYELTQRAVELEPKVRAILDQSLELYRSPPISSADLEAEINIAMLDDCCELFIHEIERSILREAPKVKLNAVSQWGRGDQLLEQGAVDFAINLVPGVGTGFFHAKLVETNWGCLMARRHRAAQKALTLESFGALRHALVTTDGRGVGIVDDRLAALGIDRKVIARTPFFGSLPRLLSGSDLVATLPRLIGERLARDHDLVLKDLPFELPTMAYSLIWHQRNHRDRLNQWIRDNIIHACRRAFTSTP
jgi:DNA-binding transcriptional LysR family regulator